MLLAALGLVGDLVAAWLLLDGQPTSGLLLHVPASLAWAVGLNVDQLGRLRRRARLRAARAPLDAPRLAVGLLGVGLFPGLGVLAGGLALSARRLLRWRRVARVDDRERPAPPLPTPGLELSERLRAIEEVAPLVEAVRAADVELRQSAIEVLSGRESGAAIALLRGLLRDVHPDVRMYASVALRRVEDRLGQSLADARAAAAARPADAAAHLALGARYRAYAISGFLDEASRRSYLERAVAAVETATALRPDDREAWRRLVRIRLDAGRPAEARPALMRALALGDGDLADYLAGMEIAFADHRWDEILELARAAAAEAPPGDREVRATIEWWSGARPVGAAP